MLPKANDENTELQRYIASVKASEATPIPQKKKYEVPNNGDINYEINDKSDDSKDQDCFE